MTMMPPILLTGTERSGIPLVMKVLKDYGVYVSSLENYQARSFTKNHHTNLISRVLDRLDYDVKGRLPVCTNFRAGHKLVRSFQFTVEKTLSSETTLNDGLWVYADHRSLLIWDLWFKSFPDAVWLVVRREGQDIINSCLKTEWMDTFNRSVIRDAIGANTVRDGWEWWLSQYNALILDLMASPAFVFEVWPDRLQSDPSHLQDLLDCCGISRTVL